MSKTQYIIIDEGGNLTSEDELYESKQDLEERLRELMSEDDVDFDEITVFTVSGAFKVNHHIDLIQDNQKEESPF